MHADLFTGMYTCHWIRWYTCAHVWKLGEFRGTSAHFQTHFQSPSEAVTLCLCYALFAPLTRPAVHFFKCSNAYRPVQWDVHLPLDQVIYLCACVEVGRISWYICALSDALSEQVKQWHYASVMLYLRLLHDLQYTFLNVLMHADLFTGMYTCHWIRWYTCAHVWKLGEFRGTSAHFQTHFQSPSEAVTLCLFYALLRLSHDLSTLF